MSPYEFPPIIFLAVIVCGSAVIIAAMGSIAWYFSRRSRLSRALSNSELGRRLERIEQIVESTAIEVERIGESNRFVTRLLAEKGESPARK